MLSVAATANAPLAHQLLALGPSALVAPLCIYFPDALERISALLPQLASVVQLSQLVHLKQLAQVVQLVSLAKPVKLVRLMPSLSVPLVAALWQMAGFCRQLGPA